MRAWQYVPGVNAGGHVTGGGFWHPGRIDGCVKCSPPAPPRPARRRSSLQADPVLEEVAPLPWPADLLVCGCCGMDTVPPAAATEEGYYCPGCGAAWRNPQAVPARSCLIHR
jgi:hypothetical protein